MLWRLLFWIWAEENAIGNEVKDNLSWLHTEKDKKKKQWIRQNTRVHNQYVFGVIFL